MTSTPAARRSSVARWGQIARELRRQIEQRDLAPGERLPSENEIAGEFGVSRITIRQALASLADDGYVHRRHGTGTFVSESFRLVQLDLAIAQPWRDRVPEQSASSKELPSDRRSDPPANLLADLGVDKENVGSRYFRRVQIVGGSPVGLTESWLAPQVARGIEDAPLIEGSLSRTLEENYGVQRAVVHSYMNAESASADLAEALDCYLDAALIVVGELAIDANGAVISCSRTRWLGSRVRFHQENRLDSPPDSK